MPYMNETPFSLREANALIPWLNGVFAETRRYVEELHLLRSVMRAAGRRASGVRVHHAPQGGAELGAEERRLLELEEGIKARVEAARAAGLLVRRVDGLVDIPAMVDGRPAYFCWRFGEERITHWHASSDDDLARQPLPGLAAARTSARSSFAGEPRSMGASAPRPSPTSGLSL
jgi:hypothetical protein